MAEYIQAWQCIGCGKIEAPQPCIGVCRDRKVLFIGKGELAASNAQQVARIRSIVEALGREVATPAEARAMLGLKGGDKVAF